ncbi:MAG: hypothetical protein AVDCRST_MAG68-5458 [uncultured Gemmatimonadetes bacterium]|uniref:Uncharacterized protein n=1 Tax=uncultured Gemmatimonadota bacterium TaxID=203437 RepID=A0A6J4MSY9_9BACT|nr:MAG: hypothetical protein AVDCRST_MAG68-5458 [uncultured Gemmatimonadota bacterium]
MTHAHAARPPRVAAGPAAREPAPGALPAWLAVLWAAALVATLAFAAVGGVHHAAVGVVTGAAFMALGAGMVVLLAPSDRVFVTRLFVGGFLARYVAALFITGAVMIAGLPGLEGGKDYLHWEASGWAVAEAWRSGSPTVHLTDKDPGYYYLVGAVFALTGRVAVAPLLLNGLFGAGAAVVAFFLALQVYDRRRAAVAGYLAAFLPTLLVWSGMVYKDVVLSFFVVACASAAIAISRQVSARSVCALGASLVPLFMIRPDTGVTIVGSAALLVGLTGRRRGSKLAALAVAGGVLLLFLAVLQGAGLGGKMDLLARFPNPLTSVAVARESWANEVGAGSSGLTRYLYGRNLLLAPHLLLAAMVLPFVLPLPGTTGGMMSIGTFLMPGQILWLLLLPGLLAGMAGAVRERAAAGIFLAGLVLAMALGVALAGYFSNPRYLVQGVPLMLVLSAAGIGYLRQRLLLYVSMLLCSVVVFCLYALARGS